MAGQFHKHITNARNSNDDFEVKIEEDPLKGGKGPKRVSAAQLTRSIIHGLGTKRHFTTITPQGLPPDLVGESTNAVERQNVLIEPVGHKNEGARLPPFKPFKTISDEDNIHLLPGETGERARLNLLDTKAVTRKDVEEVRTAYFRLREQYPELYSKQQAPGPEIEEAATPANKKKGFFGKWFAKKKKEKEKLAEAQQVPKKPEEDKSVPPPVSQPQELPKPEVEEHKPSQKRESGQAPQAPAPNPVIDEIKPAKGQGQGPSVHLSISQGTTSSEVSEDEENESDVTGTVQQWQPPTYDAHHHHAQKEYYNQVMQWYNNMAQQQQQYPGFPGGYGMPPYNQAYANGFGPMQGPPQFNPCIDEIQYGSQNKKKPKGPRKFKKPQGLNFDFLPHDDLATEVTMTIEPDDPTPLEYAVENGIMPIICCYMPSSLAVSQQQQQTNAIPFYGHPVTSHGHTGGQYSSKYYDSSNTSSSYYSNSSNSTSTTTGSTSTTTDTSTTSRGKATRPTAAVNALANPFGSGNRVSQGSS